MRLFGLGYEMPRLNVLGSLVEQNVKKSAIYPKPPLASPERRATKSRR